MDFVVLNVYGCFVFVVVYLPAQTAPKLSMCLCQHTFVNIHLYPKISHHRIFYVASVTEAWDFFFFKSHYKSKV